MANRMATVLLATTALVLAGGPSSLHAGDEPDPRPHARIIRHRGETFGKILARLDDPEPEVRASAIDELGALGDPWAIEPLIRMVGDTAGLRGSDNWVGGHAANALVAITHRPFSVDQAEWQAWWAEQKKMALLVRHTLLGNAGEHNDAMLRPNRFWKKHAVFQLVNYTFPHIPDCRVAVGANDEIRVLRGRGDRVQRKGEHALENFNRCAREEKLALGEADAEPYARFALECWASLSPKENLSLTRDGDAWLARVRQEDAGGLVRFELRLRADGTVALDEKR